MDSNIWETINSVVSKDSKLVKNNIKVKRITQEYQKNDYISDMLMNIEIDGVNASVLFELKLDCEINEYDIEKAENILVNNNLKNKCLILIGNKKASDHVLQKAEKARIRIINLDDVKEEDWDGRIKQINVNMKMITPEYLNLNIYPNIEVLRKIIKEKGLKEFSFSVSGLADDIRFLDKNSKEKISLKEIFDYGEKQIKEKELIMQKVEYSFDTEAFIQTQIGLIPIEKVEYDRKCTIINNPIVVDYTKNIGVLVSIGIIKELINNKEYLKKILI